MWVGGKRGVDIGFHSIEVETTHRIIFAFIYVVFP
jgi:hypothetical protein